MFDIYYTRNETIEIHIQGGIDAANGISSIFMVNAVMAVPTSDKVKRDASKAANSHSQGKKQESLFSQILNQTVEEAQEAPRECHMVTYGQDCMLRTFQYQKREYHY